MSGLSRRTFIKVLGEATALGAGLSFGAGCEKEEPDVKKVETAKGAPPADAPRILDNPKGAITATAGGVDSRSKKLEGPIDVGRKKIVALSCGSENGNNETFIRAAAIGAGEFGIDTEIIRAATLNIQHLEAREADDLYWIHEKTLLEDCALIVAVPCYHIRANALLYTINERMLGIMGLNPWITKPTRVGAVIGVGNSGYDAWASLVNLSTEIFMQHTRVVVDQMMVTFNGLREWNLWMQQGKPLTSHTHLARMIDTPPEKYRTIYPGEPQLEFNEWYTMVIERAKQLGRNVAQAMNMPIEQVEYHGEKAGVECPLCHCNVLLVPEDLPYVGCPICWIRGTIKVDGDKMKVDWHMEDLKLKRFGYEGQIHHSQCNKANAELFGRNKNKDWAAEYKSNVITESNKYAKVITPT